MTGGLGVRSIEPYTRRIDWKLLVFLLLFLNVKLVVKLAALIIVYLMQPDLRFGFRMKNSRLPLFYPVVMLIALFNWVLYQGYTDTNYSIAVLTGLSFWMAGILAIHQLRLFTERNNAAVISNTIKAFLVLNAIASLAQIGSIILETGAINPYRYQGNYQKYFMGTGDYIKGITFDTCTTNALLNVFGLVYFLFRKQAGMVLLCFSVLLLTASNLVNILLALVLIWLFIRKTDRDGKTVIALCFFLLIAFLVKVSPQNNDYLVDFYEKLTHAKKQKKPEKIIPLLYRPDSVLNSEEKKEKFAMLYLDSLSKGIADKKKKELEVAPEMALALQSGTRPEIPEPSIHTPPFQYRNDTNAAKKELIRFIEEENLQQQYPSNVPGKVLAWKQSFRFFKEHPFRILTGNGMGRFSSKLAFRATALKFAGGYPGRFRYVQEDFKDNHLDLYSWFFSRRDTLHSVTNTPFSVYDQLLSEYGLAGILAFALFYMGYFGKQRKKLSYGWPLIALLAAFLFTDYWFEQLSVIPFFELLLFLNLKDSSVQYAAA